MARSRKRPQRTNLDDFLDTPMYQLVDRHRAILEKIRTRDDAQYWGLMLMGQYYPEVARSRAASGKLAEMVGFTDYMDFFCAEPFYDLLKEGKTLKQAQKVMRERMARNIKQLSRILGTKKPRESEFRARVGAKGDVVIPKDLRSALGLGPGSEVTFSSEGDRIVLRAARRDPAATFERIARSGRPIHKVRPHGAYENEFRSRRP